LSRSQRKTGSILLELPLLGIAVLIYNILAWVGTDPTAALVSLALPSGAHWGVSPNDFILFLGVGLLFIETAKSTRTTNKSIVDAVLSTALFAVCLIEFTVVQFAGTSTFFALLLMTTVDVIAGFTVSLIGSRRDHN